MRDGSSPALVDVAIVGGGIVGVASAAALVAHDGLSVTLLEAEERLAAHQTGNNSGVIHSGLYYRPGSLKARTCREGRELLYRFCRDEGIAHDRCGKIVVAIGEQELPRLDELERRGRANGLEGVRRLTAAELRALEPAATGLAGLHVPETGIVDYVAVTERLAERVRRRHGTVLTGARVYAIRPERDRVHLESTQGPLACRLLVNCAGLQSDRVARLGGSDPGVRIVPFRGEYYELTPERRGLVRNLIYPVPDPRLPFLGVHFTRLIDGRVEAGPNAVLAFKREGYRRTSFSARDMLETLAFPGFWRMAAHFWKTGMGEYRRSLSKTAFVAALQRLLPELRPGDVHPGGAGVRAQAVDPSGALVDDFRIVEGPRMIHVLNAPSPAATASLSIGGQIARMAHDHLGRLDR
jgi:L-2-hydroxyglutarate oxidase